MVILELSRDVNCSIPQKEIDSLDNDIKVSLELSEDQYFHRDLKYEATGTIRFRTHVEHIDDVEIFLENEMGVNMTREGPFAYQFSISQPNYDDINDLVEGMS